MTRTRIATLLVALALAAPAAGAAAQDDTLRLSLDEAIERARAENPAFLAARNDRTAADWEVREAYASLLPSASTGLGMSWQGAGEQRFGSLILAENQPSYLFSSYDLGVSYQLSGATLLAPSAARARRSVTEAGVRAADVQLVAAVTRAYLEVLRQQEGLAVTAQQLERARFNLRLATGQQEVGVATPLDVRQAEVQVGRAEVALLQGGNALNTARLRLLQQLGTDLDRPVRLTTTFALEEPVWERDALLELALERNPVLASRRASVDAGDVQVKQARSAYLPSLSAQAGISGFTRQASSSDPLVAQAQAGVAQQVQQCVFINEIYRRLTDPLPTQDCSAIRFTDQQRAAILDGNDAFPFGFTSQPASASLSISLPLFQGLSRQRQLEAARVQREDAQLQVREQRLALAADVTVGVSTVSTAYRSAVLEARNREVADEQLRLAGERYRVGAITFVDLVDAETVKAEADQAYVTAVFAYHDAVTELEAVVGVDLRE